jgi:hypothetical protein
MTFSFARSTLLERADCHVEETCLSFFDRWNGFLNPVCSRVKHK